MNRDLESEVVGGGGGSAEIEDTNVGVGGDAGENVGGMGREGGGISAAVCGECEERLRTMRRPDPDGAVPAG